MQTQTTTSKRMQEVNNLIYAFDKMIPIYIQKMEQKNNNQVFMCNIAQFLESKNLTNLVLDFLEKDRPTFNYWVANNYSSDIINPNNYSVFLCSRHGFTEQTLNNIRLNYLQKTLEILKRLQ